MTFTDFVCLLLGARPGEAGREAGRSTQADPHSYTKRLWAGANAPARSPLIKTLS